MRHVPTLFRRELASYFLSPMAFLILLAFQAIAWLNFWDLIDGLARNTRAFSGLRDPLNSYISGSTPFWIGLLVALPALTMRLLSEERRSGTIEPLLTAPVTETEIVLAKWLAGLGMYLALLIPFALYLPFLYFQAKYRFDLGPVLSMGLGLTTLGMMFVAIGLFFSALTKNQIVAAISTFAVLFLLILISSVGYTFAVARRASWAEAMQFVSVLHQVNTFGSGQLDLRFLALHLSACVLMLYLTVKVLQYRREA
ncbi:ABC transporter permease [Tundrisphaera lichenicola]|uniref:ABC transporter permease n=1 Tax=Tundrisphaera lichenicola TaxID=2029860 RepID=UPI003EBF3725